MDESQESIITIIRIVLIFSLFVLSMQSVNRKDNNAFNTNIEEIHNENN